LLEQHDDGEIIVKLLSPRHGHWEGVVTLQQNLVACNNHKDLVHKTASTPSPSCSIPQILGRSGRKQKRGGRGGQSQSIAERRRRRGGGRFLSIDFVWLLVSCSPYWLLTCCWHYFAGYEFMVG